MTSWNWSRVDVTFYQFLSVCCWNIKSGCGQIYLNLSIAAPPEAPWKCLESSQIILQVNIIHCSWILVKTHKWFIQWQLGYKSSWLLMVLMAEFQQFSNNCVFGDPLFWSSKRAILASVCVCVPVLPCSQTPPPATLPVWLSGRGHFLTDLWLVRLLFTSICSSKSYPTQIFVQFNVLRNIPCPIKKCLQEKQKFDFGICTSYGVSGCSLKEYPQNFNKGKQNLNLWIKIQ